MQFHRALWIETLFDHCPLRTLGKTDARCCLEYRVLRVAIADDDRLCRQTTKSFLAKEHDVNIVAECTEVQELIDALREHRPDVLLLDPQIPGFSGRF
jgi:PleD family two-component response regulator